MSDLRALIRERSGHQWIAAGLAVVIPAVIIFAFWYDAKVNIMPGPQLIYVDSWSASRTDEEIKAQQKIDQAKKEKAQRARQESYKKLQDQLGIE